jgi:uncharacterized coiled-coil DUF342 family protein
MARLEGSYEQLGKRLGDLAADLHALRTEFRTEIQALRTEIQTLRTEIQGVRAEFQTGIQGVRAELQAEIQGVRTELQTGIQGVRAEMGRLFYWLMGTCLTTLVAIGGVIVTILVRTR